MRAFLVLLLLIAAAVAALWLGGESWLASEAGRQAAARRDLALAEARPLRKLGRIGVELVEPAYTSGDVSLALPGLELWVAPADPAAIRVALPDRALLRQAGRDHRVDLRGGAGALRVSPLHGGAIRQAGIQAAMLTLDGAPLAEAVSVDMQMAGLGHEAPRGARAAYDATLTLAGMRPGGLAAMGAPTLPLPGDLSVTGALRVWLDGILDLAVVRGAAAPPAPVALRADGVEVTLGGATARLAGMIRRDAAGRAEGRLAIYTGDGDALLRAAGEAGMLPAEGAMLASALLAGIGRMPFPPESEADGMTLPEAAGQELRLPLVMRGGRLLLGDIDLGAAPAFPAWR